ncbi:hypothetical protein FGLOB1_434 [Fusarium globosum]|uniref:Uncharacterized protein n=1 Tax=Fusarium globosum TaxID=78864 RepID=A0A8H6DKL9_9HYPO|nr:hypothetical protein FGLOB1_434 [Fusarium globosum]
MNSPSTEEQRPRRQLITSIVQPAVAPIQQTPLQQVPARRAALPASDIKIQFLAFYLQGCRTPQQTSEKFTRGLQMVTDSAAEMASVLSYMTNNCWDRGVLYQEAVRETARVQSGYWDGYFRMVAADTQWLTNNWGGPNWLPADIRAGLEKAFGTPVPSSYVRSLVSITQAAQTKGIGLDSLWAEDGALRTAVGDGGRQCLSSELGQNIIDQINDEASSIVSEASHQGQQTSTAARHDSGSEKPNDIKVEMSESSKPTPTQTGPIHETPSSNDNDNLPATVDVTMAHEHVAQMQAQPTNDGAQSAPPVTRKRTFEQMNSTANSMYDKYKTLMTSFKAERIAQLQAEAIEKLERAESEKAATDHALVTLRAREDQLQQFRDHSKRLIHTTSSGLREQANHDIMAGALANMREAYFNGVNKLLDSFLQMSSGSLDGCTIEDLQARQTEAVDRVDKAKKRVRALDHMEKARAAHENYIEMMELRQTMRTFWMQTGERVKGLETACVAAFSHAEEED